MCKIFSENLKNHCRFAVAVCIRYARGGKPRARTQAAPSDHPRRRGDARGDADRRRDRAPHSDRKKFNKLLTVGKIPNIEGMSVEPLQRFNAENIDVGMTIHAPAC